MLVSVGSPIKFSEGSGLSETPDIVATTAIIIAAAIPPPIAAIDVALLKVNRKSLLKIQYKLIKKIKTSYL